MPFKHQLKVHGFCRGCGIALCSHHHRNLRGCMREAGHSGNHINFTSPDEEWTDADGAYVNTQEVWAGLVDGIVGTGAEKLAPFIKVNPDATLQWCHPFVQFDDI